MGAIIRERLTVKEIIRKTGIPPGKVYSVLKSLSERGIISESGTRPKKFYVDNPVKMMVELIEQKQTKNDEAISKARLMISALPRNRNDSNQNYFFKIGVVPSENMEIQLKMFNDAKEEVCQILNSKHKPDMNRQHKDVWEESIKKAIGRGVKFRAIYHKNTLIPPNIIKLPKDRFEIRRTSNDLYRLDIVDDKKIMIKIVYDDPLLFGGIIFVENEKLAKNLKAIFEDVWKNSEK